MAIHSIQSNVENTKMQPSLKQRRDVKPYLKAAGRISTEQNVKPLPGQGHLIHDNPVSSVKYFFKDINYDLKSLKNGYNGTANDHQLGRLNDVGLKLGGLSIAAYLATRTTNPKARLMEFVGLGAFLASMSLYPKIAINKPARIIHGFDIDKQFIDDQGRKKSVFQDSNYIPFDLYRGEKKSEDLDVIGDRMGIPRDIVNRHDLIKEQMRKIATQNNTLWMLTAGLATPAMAGLASCALEEPISNGLAHYRNAKYNNQIEEVYNLTKNMDLKTSSLKENSLSKDVVKILNKYQKEGFLPETELDNLIDIIAKDFDKATKDSLESDIRRLFETSSKGANQTYLFNTEIFADSLNLSTKDLKARKNVIDKYIKISDEELKSVVSKVLPEADLSKGRAINSQELDNIINEVEKVIDQKITNLEPDAKAFLERTKKSYLLNIKDKLQSSKTLVVNEEVINIINKLSMILGDFRANQSVIEKCQSFKFAHAPETIIANYSGKFERAFLKELGFTQKELFMIRESTDYAMEILEKRLSEIAKDEVRYSKVVNKLVNIIAEMENALHGSAETESVIKKLVIAIENNSNNTAKRLANLGDYFEGTIKSMVNEDLSSVVNKYESDSIFKDFMEGILANARDRNHKLEIGGVGSYKDLQIANIFERYQGSTSSFYRILETLDVYKRASDVNTYAPELAKKHKGTEYVNNLINAGKKTILDANCSDHMNKLNTTNNGDFFKDLINTLFRLEKNTDSFRPKGALSEATVNAAGESKANKSVLERLRNHIGRIYDIVPNNKNDFVKENTHRINPDKLKSYDKMTRTEKAIFDMLGQEPTEFLKGAAGRKYGTNKWLSIIGGITASVFAVTLLAQFGFGKIRNPQNIKKQVNDDSSK